MNALGMTGFIIGVLLIVVVILALVGNLVLTVANILRVVAP